MKKFCLKGTIKAVTYKLHLCALIHGGGRIAKSSFTPAQLDHLGTFKLSGGIKDVTFFLKFCALWFSGKAIVDVPPEELTDLKARLFRTDRRRGSARW